MPSRSSRSLSVARHKKTKPNQEPLRVTTSDHLSPKSKHPPQLYIFVTLNPSTGHIQAELHEKGSPLRHVVQINDLESLRRILEFRRELILHDEVMCLGEDGHPTEAQIRHWENHSGRSAKTKLQSNCPFCISEARADAGPPKSRKFDTRGNLIKGRIQSASQLGIKKVAP
jgi:hypothetical protein